MAQKLTTEQLIQAAGISRDDLKNFVRRKLLSFSGQRGVAREFSRDDVLLAVIIINIRYYVKPDRLQAIARELAAAANEGVAAAALSPDSWVAVDLGDEVRSIYERLKKPQGYHPHALVVSLVAFQGAVDEATEKGEV